MISRFIVELGALVEPLAVAWRATKKANVKPADKVLIQGAGPVRVFPHPYATVESSISVGCHLHDPYGEVSVLTSERCF